MSHAGQCRDCDGHTSIRVGSRGGDSSCRVPFNLLLPPPPPLLIHVLQLAVVLISLAAMNPACTGVSVTAGCIPPPTTLPSATATLQLSLLLLLLLLLWLSSLLLQQSTCTWGMDISCMTKIFNMHDE